MSFYALKHPVPGWETSRYIYPKNNEIALTAQSSTALVSVIEKQVSKLPLLKKREENFPSEESLVSKAKIQSVLFSPL